MPFHKFIVFPIFVAVQAAILVLISPLIAVGPVSIGAGALAPHPAWHASRNTGSTVARRFRRYGWKTIMCGYVSGAQRAAGGNGTAAGRRQ